MRLSENNVTVLCIEGGPLDQYEEGIQFPEDEGSKVGSQYDWGLATVGQRQLDDRTRPFPQGRGVGGGSLINGMVWNRGHMDDFRSWETLGNPGWGWDSLLGYFRKALEELSIPVIADPNAGGDAGGYYLPSIMHPTNQTRSDARRAYLDPYIGRPNFNVIYNSHVTQILFQNFTTNVSQPSFGDNPNGRGNATSSVSDIFGVIRKPTPITQNLRPRQTVVAPSHATAVEFAENASAPRQIVQARREVIVAAGALHSPQVLQLSGLGPAALLQRFNISVAQDLPGVGNNLQDHSYIPTNYHYNNASYRTLDNLTRSSAFGADAERIYRANKTGPWTARVSTAIAFVSLPQITNDTSQIISSGVNAGSIDPSLLPPGYESTLLAGYAQQLSILSSRLSHPSIPSHEIITNGAGGFTLTIQHPFSRGYTEIRSSDPFDTPLIDPRWGANPADITAVIRAIQLNQRILSTSAFDPLHPSYTPSSPPGPNATEFDLRHFISEQLQTEYHPSGTCAMLPRELGGVVDPNLMVYGTDNLRVVDASIMPMIPGAHLMAPTYAVAEKAADVIKMHAGDLVQPLPEVGNADSSNAWVQWMAAVLGGMGAEETRGEAETW
ncbi:MAG: hypothetical protein Q9160_005078 [Pyrenula sp. 1 TL-2023]